ncbi:MAG: hypothetical protein ABI680_00940 [Chthoniobacteraceae bacterium]
MNELMTSHYSNTVCGAIAAVHLMLCAISPAQAQPAPGEVFREYAWAKPDGDAGGSLRVGGKLDYGGGPLAWPQTLDLENVIKAEVQLAKVLCHDGTHGLAIQINGRDWTPVPETEGIPEPQSDYQHFTFPVVHVPLADLKAGAGNTFALRVSKEHPWDWPQNLIYGIVLRIYYDPAQKAHPTGQMTWPQSGATIGRSVPLRVEPESAGSALRQVEFVGLFDGVNWEGDGNYRQWHGTYFQGELTNHLGTVKAAPWQVEWDTSWVPDQTEPMQIAARITDESGLTFLTPPSTGLKFDWPGLRVELCRPYDVPKQWVTRKSEKSEKFRVAGDLSRAAAAQLVWSSWSPGYMNGEFINGQKVFESEGPRYACFWHRVPLADLGVLHAGENVLTTGLTPKHDGKMVHGMEVNWPGIMVLIQYRTQP